MLRIAVPTRCPRPGQLPTGLLRACLYLAGFIHLGMNPCTRQHLNLSRHTSRPCGPTDHCRPGSRSLAGSSPGTLPPKPRALWVDGYWSGFIQSSDVTEHLRRARYCSGDQRQSECKRLKSPPSRSSWRGRERDDKQDQTKYTARRLMTRAKEKRAGAETMKGPGG